MKFLISDPDLVVDPWSLLRGFLDVDKDGWGYYGWLRDFKIDCRWTLFLLGDLELKLLEASSG